MRTQSTLFRLTATTTIVGLAMNPLLAPRGWAQSAPSPDMVAPGPDAPTGDPPARAGRLSRVDGSVSFHGAGSQ